MNGRIRHDQLAGIVTLLACQRSSTALAVNEQDRHCHGKRLSADRRRGVEPFHAAVVAACHCSIAFALKRRSVRREMR
jgi:hypothetical protein